MQSLVYECLLSYGVEEKQYSGCFFLLSPDENRVFGKDEQGGREVQKDMFFENFVFKNLKHIVIRYCYISGLLALDNDGSVEGQSATALSGAVVLSFSVPTVRREVHFHGYVRQSNISDLRGLNFSFFLYGASQSKITKVNLLFVVIPVHACF